MNKGLHISSAFRTVIGIGFTLVILFSSCAPKVASVSQVRTNNTELDDQIQEDSAINAFIVPYRDSLQEEMGERLVRVLQIMKHEGRNSQIGHWMCDLIQKEGSRYVNTPPDAVFYNPGGIRIAIIDTGWLTKGRIYELVPFDNYLVQLEMDSSQIQMLCDHMADLGGWPTSQGFTYDIFRDKALNIKINGVEIVGGKSYAVMTNDYVANGGDQCDFLIPIPRSNTGVLIRDLILRHLRNKEDPVNYPPKRRVELMME